MGYAKVVAQIVFATVLGAQAVTMFTNAAPKAAAYQPAVGAQAQPASRSIRDLSAQCLSMPVPGSGIATQSKYDGFDATKSHIDRGAQKLRDNVVGPIQVAVRDLGSLAFDPVPSVSEKQARLECGVQTLVRWADAGALLHAGSKDFALTRGRLLAELSLSLLEFDRQGVVAPTQKEAIVAWLAALGHETMTFFAEGAGPRSSVNNHRYWAGLALTAIGIYTDDQAFIDWGNASFEAGICQVTADGTLPLELDRGQLARNYHVYALRPLAVTARLLNEHGIASRPACTQGLARLTTVALAGIRDPNLFSVLTGQEQTALPDESTFVKPLRLNSWATVVADASPTASSAPFTLTF